MDSFVATSVVATVQVFSSLEIFRSPGAVPEVRCYQR
jgi:hypothetical protein